MLQEVLGTVQHLLCPVLDVVDRLERSIGPFDYGTCQRGILRRCIEEDLGGCALGTATGRGRRRGRGGVSAILACCVLPLGTQV